MADTITTTYNVEGMSCEHCVHAVTTEVKGVANVTDVAIDLSDGRVTVTSTAPLDDAVIAAAIDEAGYELKT